MGGWDSYCTSCFSDISFYSSGTSILNGVCSRCSTKTSYDQLHLIKNAQIIDVTNGIITLRLADGRICHYSQYQSEYTTYHMTDLQPPYPPAAINIDISLLEPRKIPTVKLCGRFDMSDYDNIDEPIILKVVNDYVARFPNEISLHQGEYVTINERGNWMCGGYVNPEDWGWFPTCAVSETTVTFQNN